MKLIYLILVALGLFVAAWFAMGDLPRQKRFARVSQLAFILVASLGVYSFVRAAQSDQRYLTCQALCQMAPQYAAQDRRVPDFELPDMSGKLVRFSEFLGDGPVVLNFWTKTCQPCLEEMPDLAEMAEIAGKRGVKVVTVTTDESPEDVRDTLHVLFGEKGPPFPVLFDPEMAVVSDKFGTSMFPETWLIDEDGVIRARIDGNPAQTLGFKWTDPVSLEVLEMMGRPGGCPVVFDGRKPQAPHAPLCGEDAPTGAIL